mmetsp:Transcript_2963/g.9369  ORF Transcript_2963/g.9369 Transcript_2963/m.9369 type:complete len:299 (+) Transcript_2963:199-1095(+)
MRMGQERGAAMDRTGPLPGLAVACWHALWARRPTPLSLPCPASDAHVGRRARRGRAPRAGRLSSRTRRGHRSRRTSRHSPRATRRSGPRGPCALSCGRSRHGRTRRPCGHSRRGRRSRSSRHHSRRHSSRRRILRTSRRSGSPFRSPRPFPGCSCRTHRRSGPSRIRRHSRLRDAGQQGPCRGGQRQAKAEVRQAEGKGEGEGQGCSEGCGGSVPLPSPSPLLSLSSPSPLSTPTSATQPARRRGLLLVEGETHSERSGCLGRRWGAACTPYSPYPLYCPRPRSATRSVRGIIGSRFS